MKISTLGALVALAFTVPVAGVQAADVRPGVVSLQGFAPNGKVRTNMRLSKKVGEGDSLLGAPLFLAFLGAVTITIGTLVIINVANGSSPK